MGCKNSRDYNEGMNVQERWKNLKMPEISECAFENEFEMLLFKTICLIRVDP